MTTKVSCILGLRPTPWPWSQTSTRGERP